MKLLKKSTQLISLEVKISYVVLPEADGFPEQIDIKEVIAPPKVKKARKRDILTSLSESEIINLEDDILKERSEK